MAKATGRLTGLFSANRKKNAARNKAKVAKITKGASRIKDPTKRAKTISRARRAAGVSAG
jgi:hypothetical protein